MSVIKDLARRYTGRHYLNRSCGNTGVKAQRDSETDAILGSEALANHCLRAFDRFASQHGIAHDEARILLLNTGTKIPVAKTTVTAHEGRAGGRFHARPSPNT